VQTPRRQGDRHRRQNLAQNDGTRPRSGADAAVRRSLVGARTARFGPSERLSVLATVSVMSAPRFYFDSAVRKHARELGFALACALVNIPVHAQTHGPTVNISAAPDGASCDPACAEGFACSQGFCVPLETTPEAPTQGSVDAPGLELGADAERQPGSTKP